MRPQDVETDGPVGVDVGVIDLGGEGDLGGLEGVVCGEVDGEEEDPSLIRTVWRTHDGGLPMKQVISYWSSAALGWWISTKVLEFLKKTLITDFLSQI